MINLYEELKTVARKLTAEDLSYALCGGLAVGVYTEPRATIDIDLVVPAEQLDRIISALAEIGFEKMSDPMPLDRGAMPIQRLIKFIKGEQEVLMLDLCMPAKERYPTVWRGWISTRLENVEISLLSLSGLIEMKRSRSSEKDLADIQALEKKQL